MIRFNCPGCSGSFTRDDSYAGRYVKCGQCGHTFQVPKQTSVSGSAVERLHPEQGRDLPSVNELVDARALVQEFWNDCTELQKLGITVSKVGMSAKIGGVGAGIGTGIAFDPLLGIALAIGGWLVDSIAKDYAMTRLEQTRMKWHNIFSCLTERQANLFASEMQNRYPHLIPAVRQMLPGA